MSDWESFFVAQAGASAALAGLVFVGISINLDEIMTYPGLSGRALEALIALLTVLAVASLMLVPGQPMMLIGAEVLAIGLATWTVLLKILVNAYRHLTPVTRRYFGSRIVMTQAAALPFVIAGIAILLLGEGGLYLTVPGVLFSLFLGMADAWILLVEIKR